MVYILRLDAGVLLYEDTMLEAIVFHYSKLWVVLFKSSQYDVVCIYTNPSFFHVV
jgi:hypothetical protein